MGDQRSLTPVRTLQRASFALSLCAERGLAGVKKRACSDQPLVHQFDLTARQNQTTMPMPVVATTPATAAPTHKLSPAQKGLLKLGLRRDIDLALHLPLRFEDETRITPLSQVRDGELAQIEGTVIASDVTLRPRRQLVVTLDDGSDTCTLRFFSFYPSQHKALAVGERVRARGEVRGGFMGRTLMHPVVKSATGALPTTLTPVYPTVAGLPQPYLRKAVQSGLARADLSDTIPPSICEQIGLQALWNLRIALSFLHSPERGSVDLALQDRSHPAWRRLAAEELLAQQISQLLAKRERDRLLAPPLLPHVESAALARASVHDGLLVAVGFKLTGAQERVCAEIAADLQRGVPMHRLLQGDVGSGKTVVAALAAARCIDAGYQCALMAPTEILASQHFSKLIAWLSPLGVGVAWLTGGQKKKLRQDMLSKIKSGEAGLVVGTHAVIQAQVQFKNLALVVIDEQHRFGVAQRLALRDKMKPSAAAASSAASTSRSASTEAGTGADASPVARPGPGAQPRKDGQPATLSPHAQPAEPHLLMMSATPIPRTLAMSYYADLDISTLDELPPGRTPIITKLVAQNRRAEVVARIRGQLVQGRQVYWVCPLIEESEALDLVNATQTHEALCAELPDQRVALLHSRMAVADKRAVMDAFVRGEVQVLVSTTVIEVGVDVPNASLMVIENAQRFGLSQLHQLRGRVGRGVAASACVLLYGTGDAQRGQEAQSWGAQARLHGLGQTQGSASGGAPGRTISSAPGSKNPLAGQPGPRLGDAARERLRAMAETSDGFEIARRDLAIRGPGEFLGARQSGAALLRFADLQTDADLLQWARVAAPFMLAMHPQLAQRHVQRWLGTQTQFLKA